MKSLVRVVSSGAIPMMSLTSADEAMIAPLLSSLLVFFYFNLKDVQIENSMMWKGVNRQRRE
jgi:hypothetical protein